MHRFAKYWMPKTLTSTGSAKWTSSFKTTRHSPDVQGLIASTLEKKKTTLTSIALIVGNNTACSVRCPGILGRAAKSTKFLTEMSQTLSNSCWERACNNAEDVAMSFSGVKAATTWPANVVMSFVTYAHQIGSQECVPISFSKAQIKLANGKSRFAWEKKQQDG